MCAKAAEKENCCQLVCAPWDGNPSPFPASPVSADRATQAKNPLSKNPLDFMPPIQNTFTKEAELALRRGIRSVLCSVIIATFWVRRPPKQRVIMHKQQASTYTYQSSLIAALLVTLFLGNTGQTFERYKNDAGGSCSDCHGDFTDSTSPKSTVFPTGGKHTMHRDSSYMSSECNLCHTKGDSRNPYLKSSDGTKSNDPGLGCIGCHLAEGLRAHHAAHGVTQCAICHPSDEPPPPENTVPPYYGTADTKVDSPCNGVAAANTNENWSVGDFLGLDNDGNTLYDMADFACGPAAFTGTMIYGK